MMLLASHLYTLTVLYILAAMEEAEYLQPCLLGLQLKIYHHALIQNPLCLIMTRTKPAGSSGEYDYLPHCVIVNLWQCHVSITLFSVLSSRETFWNMTLYGARAYYCYVHTFSFILTPILVDLQNLLWELMEVKFFKSMGHIFPCQLVTIKHQPVIQHLYNALVWGVLWIFAQSLLGHTNDHSKFIPFGSNFIPKVNQQVI